MGIGPRCRSACSPAPSVWPSLRWCSCRFREIFYGPFQGLISVIYLGTPAAILGAIAVRRGGRREWLLVVVAALALLLGAYGGQVSMAMERLHLVLFSWRYAVKFIYPAAFVVALLAARGAEEISQDEPGRRTIPTLLIVGAVLLLGAMIGLHRLGNSVLASARCGSPSPTTAPSARASSRRRNPGSARAASTPCRE